MHVPRLRDLIGHGDDEWAMTEREWELRDAAWPDDAPEPLVELGHGDHTPDDTEGPWRT